MATATGNTRLYNTLCKVLDSLRGEASAIDSTYNPPPGNADALIQAKVDESDRRSNDAIHLDLQREVFQQFGLYYERKRGEFSDGIHYGYVGPDLVVNREKLVRV